MTTDMRHAPNCNPEAQLDWTTTTVGPKHVTVFRCNSCGAVALSLEEPTEPTTTTENR